MASSLLGRLNPFSPVAGSPVVAPRPAVKRSRPQPAEGEAVDRPEVALRQIIKMQVLDAVMPPRPTAAMRTQLIANLRALHQIPALESLARGFSRVVSRPDVTIDEVVASVSKDPALSVRILRLANAVEVSPEQRIDRLDVAVQMLGLERVRKAADALFFLGVGSQTCAGLDWHHLWVHSLGTAAIAEWLEQNLRGGDGSVVYVGGLLHDIGKIVLSTLAPDAYKALLIESWNESQPLESLERSRLGVDHGEAGVAFAEQNQMAASILDVIRHHAAPEQAKAHRYEVALVALANHLAKAYGFGFSGSTAAEDPRAIEELPAWPIIAEATGTQLDFVDLEEDLQEFSRKLRADLMALRGA